MSDTLISTAPKPFVFVLMPFKKEFNDIYKFGIKGAAEDVGAYSERVDEQNYTESMLDRIYNQISKADVIIADMTGQNPNVFYEVGYAHALNKIVLLLTQDSNDIPFDLKHRPHIVYGGQIETLRNQLAQKLTWAISEVRTRGKAETFESYAIIIQDTFVPKASTLENAPLIELYGSAKDLNELQLKILVKNISPEKAYGSSHIYLYTLEESCIRPLRKLPLNTRGIGRRFGSPISPINSNVLRDSSDLPVQYRLDVTLPGIPPGATEELNIGLKFIIKDSIKLDSILNKLRVNAPQDEEPLVLRIHTYNSILDFPFKLKVTVLITTPPEKVPGV